MWVRTYRKQKSRYDPNSKEYILTSAWHIYHSYRVQEDKQGISDFYALTNDGFFLEIPGVQFKKELGRKDKPCTSCFGFHLALSTSVEQEFVPDVKT